MSNIDTEYIAPADGGDVSDTDEVGIMPNIINIKEIFIFYFSSQSSISRLCLNDHFDGIPR